MMKLSLLQNCKGIALLGLMSAVCVASADDHVQQSSHTDASLSAPHVTAPSVEDNSTLTAEQQLQERQRILTAARKALETRFKILHQTMAGEAEHLDNRNLVSQDAAKKLVGIYENMRPREAAGVFNIMDPHVMIALAASMNIRKLSGIMAHMNPDRVNMISQYLVGVRHFRQQTISIPVMTPTDHNMQEEDQHAAFGEHEALMPSRQ